ncbi:MAG: DUF2238 domain-containing protein [Gemmatimonadetes bacterium]|nr:DUF2238 domain-containing protein [Gemmatimonadota bacterium]NIQ52111.1 DUF2238 domain-containing protein [Gemmatimonadota bacterium]NIU72222.1 DUF2238 domain-containing protein [Gammaproteobacteria bacterium]NIX42744.1 DUF2238 domain-containing protein [Gemmatimonadota bacterium]NIY06910.1 DUF2238 domain-containing protein [Gemmatimonadota bacterium]
MTGRSDPADRSVVPVAAFTAAYLLAAVAGAVVTGNAEFIVYVAVVVLLIPAVWLVHRTVRLAMLSLWFLSLWGLLHMLGGLAPVPAGWPINGENAVLYSLWLVPEVLKYDHVVHAFGFGVTTWVCWQGLRGALRRGGREGRPTGGLMVLAAAAGLGFGALNEVIEFAATLALPETNVGGYVNTGWDLVANLVGATVAVILIVALDRRRTDGIG